MNDTRRKRVAYLAESLDDLTKISSKTVTIRISTSLPFATISDDYIAKTTYEIEDYVPKKNSELINTLVDPDYKILNKQGNLVNGDRFILLTEINSSMTFSKARLYYDKKYQDIIVVPDLESLGTTSVTEGQSYVVDGYVIGAMGAIDSTSDAIVNVKEEVEYRLSDTKSNIQSSTIFIETRGVGYGARRDMRIYKETSKGIKYFNKNTSVTALIKLGKAKDIFVNPPQLPLYHFYQSSIKEYSGKYLGVVDTADTDIYVPINF